MVEKHYPRAPIIQAVIEVNLDGSVPANDVERVSRAAARRYATVEEHVEKEVTVDLVVESSNFTEIKRGRLLWSKDRTDLLSVMTTSIAFTRMAPYSTWEDFTERAKRDWEDWVDVFPRVRYKRVGVRFINRIDIPLRSGKSPRPEEYLNLYPRAPVDEFSRMQHFLVQAEWPVANSKCVTKVTSATVVSPLIDHRALLLDVDVMQLEDIPSTTTELWTLIDSIRVHKNSIFEALITDNARETFR